uniref:Uncharacterized protein n=1 Tax=Gadus morhua TaxID=8049 RepID=A0A8C5CWT2_GADMO
TNLSDLRSFHDLRPRRPVGEANITVHQQQALNKLKSHHEIIIKPADKGGQIVIQDRTNYILEATRQLNDPVYYRPLTDPMYLETQTMVRLLIDQMRKKHLISAKQAHYLYGPDLPRARLFYLLPKIHKPPENWTVPFPGRPVLPEKKNTEQKLIPLITTFSRQLGPLKQAIKQHFNSAIPQTAPLASFKILMSYRRNKNLQDILVHTTPHSPLPHSSHPL